MNENTSVSQIPSVVELNMEMEPLVVQASTSRTRFFADPYKPLTFVHFADIHAKPELWSRVVSYIDHYSNYISFGIHAGDYCGKSQEQFVDMYSECPTCSRPLLNCVGNHDTDIRRKVHEMSPEKVRAMLFPRTEDWGVNFMDAEGSMSYYKDFPESNIRFIVLDCYYNAEMQNRWLKKLLDESIEKGYHVITVSHEACGVVKKLADVSFQSIEDFDPINDVAFGRKTRNEDIGEIIADYKDAGGIHIAHLCGHYHSDLFGYTARGVLNVGVACATDFDGWCDGKRIRGTRTYDCFNVVAVDTVLHHLKLIRIGNNVDHFMRTKRAMCYDYVCDKVISDM
ncbi:MAG: metallophosphoesterase [Clostridia bacterium]|nr:metallophosphoesterase [Clostridia bacterium]